MSLSIETSLESRIYAVQDQIRSASKRSGRDLSEITLVAVSKTVERPDVDEAYRQGIRIFGENRVQDARAKFANPLPPDAELHMIGSLQTNKSKQAVGLFAMIHSVDRSSLVDELAKQANLRNRIVPVLLEINVAGETQKAGCPSAEATSLLEHALSKPGIEVFGLMTMAPLTVEPEETRPVFRRLCELRRKLEASTGAALPALSMGMSNDFVVAIEEGATHVRIGRAIFGG